MAQPIDVAAAAGAKRPSAIARWFPASRWWGRALRAWLALAPMWLAAFGLPVCPSAIAFHQPCPGCGLTRAGLALLHGDFVGAYHFNPIAVVVVPFYWGGLAWFVARYVVTGNSKTGARVGYAVGLVGVALMIVWAARFFGAFGGPVAV